MFKTNLKLTFVFISLLFTVFEINAQTGHIQIVSDPGITVFLDGIYKGKTNADMGGLVIETVSMGSHNIKLVKEGFKPQEENIVIKTGEVFLIKAKDFVAKSHQEINASIPIENPSSEKTIQADTNSTTQPDGTTDLFTDPRDGKTYKSVKIGSQIWMAENLSYKPSSGLSWAYDNDQSNIAKYAYMYDWQTAKNACPMGWHLPSNAEVKELRSFVGKNGGNKLKAKSSYNRKFGMAKNFNPNGTDDYGFSVLAGGLRNLLGRFDGIGEFCCYWTSDEKYADDAFYYFFSFSNYILVDEHIDKRSGLYVRCIKD
ncbi:MAG: FISUMP domain-containing protein [Tenuifilaceae bacterium]